MESFKNLTARVFTSSVLLFLLELVAFKVFTVVTGADEDEEELPKPIVVTEVGSYTYISIYTKQIELSMSIT